MIKYKESNFQKEFNIWIKDNHEHVKKVFGSALALELKVVKGLDENKVMSIRFDRVMDHQLEALISAGTEKGLIQKIPDMPKPFLKKCYANPKCVLKFNPKKPFDCFYISGGAGYIVILFYIPRKKKTMYWIHPDNFIGHREMFYQVGRKSIRETEIATFAEATIDMMKK